MYTLIHRTTTPWNGHGRRRPEQPEQPEQPEEPEEPEEGAQLE